MFLQLAVKHRATASKLSRREFYDFKQFYHLKETWILDLWPCGVTISAFVLIRLWDAHLRKATVSLQHCPSLERLTNRFFFPSLASTLEVSLVTLQAEAASSNLGHMGNFSLMFLRCFPLDLLFPGSTLPPPLPILHPSICTRQRITLLGRLWEQPLGYCSHLYLVCIFMKNYPVFLVTKQIES